MLNSQENRGLPLGRGAVSGGSNLKSALKQSDKTPRYNTMLWSLDRRCIFTLKTDLTEMHKIIRNHGRKLPETAIVQQRLAANQAILAETTQALTGCITLQQLVTPVQVTYPNVVLDLATVPITVIGQYPPARRHTCKPKAP